MIVAIQAGDKDKDPGQTSRHMKSALGSITSRGDSVVYIDQPTTMMDQALPVSQDLGLDVKKITCDFMTYGTDAVQYAMEVLVAQADTYLVLSGDETLCPIDRLFMSNVAVHGHTCTRLVVPYERIAVL